MKLWEALKKLEEGFKVRHVSWGAGRYTTINEDHEDDISVDKMVEKFKFFDALSDDWEVLVEPKKIRLYSYLMESRNSLNEIAYFQTKYESMDREIGERRPDGKVVKLMGTVEVEVDI